MLSNVASIHSDFASRALSGAHSCATYSYSFSCEPVSEYFLDEATNLCRPQLPVYKLASGVCTAAWVVAAASLIWIGVHVLAMAMVRHWETPLHRASSRAFMLFLLALLAAFSLGSMLYAAVPDVALSPADGSTPHSDSTARRRLHRPRVAHVRAAGRDSGHRVREGQSRR